MLETSFDTVLETLHDVLRPVQDAVGRLLVLFHAAGLSWPLAIVALVVLARLLLVPLFVAQQRSALRAATVRPVLAEIRARYRGRTGPASRQAQQTELLAAHREAGVNPLVGCLPALLQSPVFLALTLTLESGTTIATFGGAGLFGAPLSAVPTDVPGALVVGIALVVVSAALQVVTMLLGTQRPPTAVLVVIPVVVAVTTVHFPIGVLLYWATSAGWSTLQQAAARGAFSARRVRRAAPHPR